MFLQLIETLVIECSHQLGIGRLTFRIKNAECPLLLLARGKLVAEGGPLQFQALVGQGALYHGRMLIAPAVLHPGKGHEQTVSVSLFVGGFYLKETVAPVNGTTLDHLISCKDAIHDMNVLVGRTHLDGNGRSVIGELRRRLIEPVIGSFCWGLVVEREQHETTLQRVTLTDGFQRMGTTLQVLVQFYRLIGLYGEPLSAINLIAHLSLDIAPRGVQQMEHGLGLLFQQRFLRHIYLEGLLAVAERQRHLSAVGFSCSICHVGSHFKRIEHRVVGLWHRQGHLYVETAIIARGDLTCKHLVASATVTHRQGAPVAAVRPPPEGCAALHLIGYLCSLHRYAGITHRGSFHGQRVACGIGLLHLWEVHMERRTLVFLHAEVQMLVVGHDGVSACDTR